MVELLEYYTLFHSLLALSKKQLFLNLNGWHTQKCHQGSWFSNLSKIKVKITRYPSTWYWTNKTMQHFPQWLRQFQVCQSPRHLQGICHLISPQCSSQKIVLEGKSGPYNPFLGARYFKKGPMYQYLSNMQKRRSSWKVKEMKMSVYLKLTWSVPFYTQ